MSNSIQIFMTHKIIISRSESEFTCGKNFVSPIYKIAKVVNLSEIISCRISAQLIDKHYVIIQKKFSKYGTSDINDKSVIGVHNSVEGLENRMYEFAKAISIEQLNYDDEMYGRWKESCIEDKIGPYQIRIDLDNRN